HIASLQDISRVITDAGLDPVSVKALEDKKVKVTAVPLPKRG
ncbi:DeoR/GlpR transcriptional regulator, partial [Bacillus spizizenii]|nr:DeoR/GlpR transcriptional regulator [Bacillus spizizenii]